MPIKVGPATLLSSRRRPAVAPLLLLVGLVLAGCAERAGPSRLEPADSVRLVRRPGIVLVDPVERRRAIAAAGAEALCAAPDLRLRSWPPPGPIGPRDGHATDTRLNPVAWLVMRAGAAGFASEDAAAREALVAALD
ncbi:MAG: hypothetical protein NZ555_13265, partial [Geminicoccaceae bacterium]|nr:hypothetical protein [Geminicoccaceae bacterium]